VRAGRLVAVRQPVILAPIDWPDVEVLVDGTWYPGELRAWFPVGDDGWNANVNCRTGVAQQYLATVPADHVREVSSP
jgi:hypothetical protein